MIGSFGEAFRLIFSGDSTLYQIIAVTLRMTLTSSLLALLIGVPIGTWLGSARFRGRKILGVLVRGTDYVTSKQGPESVHARVKDMVPLIREWIEQDGYEK